MSETIKLVYTYSVATIVIVGGLAMLYFTRLDPPETDIQGLRLLLSGFIGAAIQFVFNRDTATASARQTERSFAQAINTQPVVTATSGPPAQVTSTPGGTA